jgi:hypothetical protein
MAKFIKRVEKGARPEAIEASSAGDWEVHFPALVEFLTALEWEPGKARATGTAMLLSEHGSWKVWLHDRDAKRSCWLTGRSIDGCLLAAEEVLRGGLADWRPDRR